VKEKGKSKKAKMEGSKNKLSERLFEFVINVLKLLRKIKFTESNRVIIYQLSKSSTSSGANYEEAQAGSSKSDFNNKVNISLKEMRETNYWLRIIKEMELVPLDETETELLIKESEELKKILGTIVFKTK
jgi:four helix bundle protein